ncbi:phosphotransferase [Corynebacterium breve]|uniref:Phosphotransferase n=1 Tax=Corynebacterium breve TaxID=3049799 RepID=A0ABY8VH01_9CORY|nr:phosphotransferase [Corynebacterium breve]WIM68934.1 phosphotransferase [Corynebacterium breve]
MDTQEIVTLAEDLLTRRYGGALKFHDVTQLSGSGTAVVLQAKVSTNPFFPHRSVVVKHSPVSGDVIDDAAFLREVVAYQFTTSLAEEVRPGPVLFAYDLQERMIVISDSGEGDNFADLLQEGDPEKRVQVLRNLGTALGKMHAGTASKEDAFTILFKRMLRQHPEFARIQELREGLLDYATRSGMDAITESGIEVPAAVKSVVNNIQDRVRHGRNRAFTPFDLAPDNIIVGERTEFLDYEWAGFRDVSFDLACVIGGFPQFISTRPIADDEAVAFVEAWVQEVNELWPAVTNEDTLHARITAALIAWAFASVSLMYHGSIARGIALREDAREALQLTDEEITNLGLITPDNFEVNTNILQPAFEADFNQDELLIRRDLYETFEALSRFAAAGRDSSYAVISEFAFELAERINDQLI